MEHLHPVVMPKLGLTMTEGVLTEWKVVPGDVVDAGDVLFVVETDKIANEIEASQAGIVEALLVEAGATVSVGSPVASLRGSAGVADAPGSDTKAEAEEVQVPDVRGRIVATPLARRQAAVAGIDLASLSGSGPRGRIMMRDLPVGTTAGAADGEVDGSMPQSVGMEREPSHGLRPLDPYRKVTARRLTESKREIPHFYVFAKADVTDLLALREQLNAQGDGPRLTVNHFIIAAAARSLAAMPEMNAVWAGDAIRDHSAIDVGIAVEGAKGLVAPVLRNLGGLTLDGIAQAAHELVARAREGRLARADLEGGAVAISNVGMFGVTALVPIVNPGQSSILGVGASQPTFLPNAQGQPVLRQVLELALSCDHRVIDGALAARFIADLCGRLETPALLLRQPTGKNRA